MDLDRIATRYLVPLLLLLLLATAANELLTNQNGWRDWLAGDRQEPLPEVLPPRTPASKAPASSPRPAYFEPDYATPSSAPVAIGETFASLSALDARMEQTGFVRVGRFGSAWPATVVEVKSDDDGIRFVRGDGTPHRYDKFDGYTLLMVRLLGQGESIGVYRSQRKRG